jgi:hypothetical protein
MDIGRLIWIMWDFVTCFLCIGIAVYNRNDKISIAWWVMAGAQFSVGVLQVLGVLPLGK